MAAFTKLLKSYPEQTHVLTISVGNTTDLVDIIDCGKFSSLHSYFRVTAQVLQFGELTRKRSLNVFKVCYTDTAIEAVEQKFFGFVLCKLRHSRKRLVN